MTMNVVTTQMTPEPANSESSPVVHKNIQAENFLGLWYKVCIVVHSFSCSKTNILNMASDSFTSLCRTCLVNYSAGTLIVEIIAVTGN